MSDGHGSAKHSDNFSIVFVFVSGVQDEPGNPVFIAGFLQRLKGCPPGGLKGKSESFQTALSASDFTVIRQEGPLCLVQDPFDLETLRGLLTAVLGAASTRHRMTLGSPRSLFACKRVPAQQTVVTRRSEIKSQ